MELTRERADAWIGADAPVQDCRMALVLPSAMKEAVHQAASDTGQSVSRWSRRALVKALEEHHADQVGREERP